MADVIVLECLGTGGGDGKFLDGHTHDGTTALAPSSFEPFTGTRWRRHEQGDVWILECLGQIHNADHRFLDGRTQDGFVGLVKTGGPPFTGTRWRARALPGGGVSLECLGDFKNPDFKFLDGNTNNHIVGMAPNTDAPFTGTHWRATAPPVKFDDNQ